MTDFKTMWHQQREYSHLFNDVGVMSDTERAAKTRELGLELHKEISQLVECVGFRHNSNAIDRTKILTDAVDIIRYTMAISNLWNYTVEEFASMWEDRELHLQEQYRLSTRKWNNENVIICDIDDVLAEFRTNFMYWINKKFNISMYDKDPQFYLVDQLKQTGMTSHEHYEIFIKERLLLKLLTKDLVFSINKLRSQGIWIHLVTARPEQNITCVYDTHRWLKDNNVQYDAITFTNEKLTFVTNTDYYINNKIIACIEDSPYHVTNYISHGMNCIMPIMYHNESVTKHEKLFRYSNIHEFDNAITTCLNNLKLKV